MNIQLSNNVLIVFTAVKIIKFNSKFSITFSLKKIKISRRLSIFLLFGIATIFVSLIFFTFNALLVLGLVYLSSIPLSYISFQRNNQKQFKEEKKDADEDDEDIL